MIQSEGGSSLQERILTCLESKGGASSLQLAAEFNEDHQKIIGALKSLESLDNIIKSTIQTEKHWEPTAEGQRVLKEGSYEWRVFQAVPASDSIKRSELLKSLTDDLTRTIGFNKALSNAWIKMDKGGSVSRGASTVDDKVVNLIKNLASASDSDKVELRKRKLVHEIVTKFMIIEKGPNFSTSVSKPETELTAEMLATGTWKTLNFRPYNMNARGLLPPSGHLHPLMKVRSEFRHIFLEMGFSEMPTNRYIESSFWNFDALFQPQQHPARDSHDTFFLTKPADCGDLPNDYVEKVKEMHSIGGHGSVGYRYDWKLSDAKKNLLRTHTTAVSARMLYQLAHEGFKPAKYFSIDKVFRNETLDATHLAEFHQVEGVVADRDLNLGNLIGILYEFFKKLGIEKLRFKPAYNPYTEPSMEIFAFHDGLDKWIEVGNSGMFRPEMLLPMGLPEDVNVIAWGLSLERPTMIKYGYDNIRDLVGPKVDLQYVYDNPLCRIEKTKPRESNSNATNQESDSLSAKEKDQIQDLINRFNNLIDSAGKLKEEVKSVKPICFKPFYKLTLYCDPEDPPYSLPVLLQCISQKISITYETHCHSSITSLPNDLKNFWPQTENQDIFHLTVIWKKLYNHRPELICKDEDVPIIGEVNIARYLARILDKYQPNASSPRYERLGPERSSKVDECLDLVTIGNNTGLKKLNSLIDSNSRYLVGHKPSVADICLWSYFRKHKPDQGLKNIISWFSSITNEPLFASS